MDFNCFYLQVPWSKELPWKAPRLQDIWKISLFFPPFVSLYLVPTWVFSKHSKDVLQRLNFKCRWGKGGDTSVFSQMRPRLQKKKIHSKDIFPCMERGEIKKKFSFWWEWWAMYLSVRRIKFFKNSETCWIWHVGFIQSSGE